MTPIKRFVIVVFKVFTEDHSDNLNHICTCPNQRALEWVVANFLALHTHLDAWCEAEPDKDWSTISA
jgi:hypothetical protein